MFVNLAPHRCRDDQQPGAGVLRGEHGQQSHAQEKSAQQWLVADNRVEHGSDNMHTPPRKVAPRLQHSPDRPVDRQTARLRDSLATTSYNGELTQQERVTWRSPLANHGDARASGAQAQVRVLHLNPGIAMCRCTPTVSIHWPEHQSGALSLNQTSLKQL